MKDTDFRSFQSVEEIEQLFCKKYSRIKMGEDIWKRIDFENYKRHTK